MVEYADGTRKFLEARYARTGDGQYFGHQPIYGYGGFSEPGHIRRFSRTVNILKTLDGLDFQSCLDVGGGEGYVSNLVRNLFEASVLNSELAYEACRRSLELYGIRSVCNDASLLPFENDSFDLVICSEALEHMVDPVLAISELDRIAKRYLLITTEQFCETERERYTTIKMTPIWIPHADRNYFTVADFLDLLGKNLEFNRQSLPDEFEYNDSEKDLDKVARAVRNLTEYAGTGKEEGIILLKRYEAQKGSEQKQTRYTISQLVEAVLMNKVDENAKEHEPMTWEDDPLLGKLRCVECENQLNSERDGLTCRGCGSKFEIRSEIPILLPHSEKLVEEKHRRLAGFYKRYDQIFPRGRTSDPRKRFHILKPGGEWETRRDRSENEYYVSKGRESIVITESRPGTDGIRFICRTTLEDTPVPLTVMADGIVRLAAVHVTTAWQTYVAPLPFAKENVEISFLVGESQKQFAELIQTSGDEEILFLLYSFETISLTPSTFWEAHKTACFEWHLPTDDTLRALEDRLKEVEAGWRVSEERLRAAEDRLQIAEQEIAHINKVLPDRVKEAEERLTKAEDKIAQINRLFPVRLYRRVRGLD